MTPPAYRIIADDDGDVFELRNDPPRHRPRRFEDNQASQLRLFRGAGDLPDQRDLFDEDEP